VVHPDLASIEDLISPLKGCGAIIQTADSGQLTQFERKHTDCIILYAQMPNASISVRNALAQQGGGHCSSCR
jgi:CheY-like chemotaxis protein